MRSVRIRSQAWVLIILLYWPVAIHAELPLQELVPFLKNHCFECHGAEKQRNELRFDELGHDLSDADTLRTWQAILDQLNLGEMPPKKQAQPAPDEARRVIDVLTARLDDAYAKHRSQGRQAVIRRLNRIELRNTLRDLLYLEGPVFRNLGMAKLQDNNGNGSVSRNSSDPIRDFPADEEDDGFDNLGERLVMSDFLLGLLIGAAEESLKLATHREDPPAVEPRYFARHIRTQGPNDLLERCSRESHPEFDAIFQRYREPGASSGGSGRVGPSLLDRRGVGTAARYRITVEVSAHNQKHPWGEVIRSRQNEPMLIGLHLCDARRGGFHDGNPTNQLLTEWSIRGDGTRQKFSFETWIDSTWFPWVGWENAPYDRSLRPSQLVEKFYPQHFKPKPDNAADSAEKQAYEPSMAAALFKAGYQGPHIRVHSMMIEPLIDRWPPVSHVALYGADDDANIQDLILQFAQRAFRMPVKLEEVTRYVDLVRAQLGSGKTRGEALRAGYTAILASPRFYYLHHSGSGGRPDQFELASRLSYFLWSSMPDTELLELAATGRLSDPAVMHAQVERLLDHRNAESFVRRFTERWLRLDRLGSMPPENGGPFRIYWDRQMEPQMVKQTDAFFAHILKTNRPIRDFIHSDYTFLNERVASILYGRDDVWGDAFRKVPVSNPKRGGILTMPAVMTATANGVDTSPVIRGVWVLENVLGTPPSPPPPDVQPLSPDLRGAKTIREQLAAHRDIASCNHCHRKIDPMGFPFENFDAIGAWREKYPDSKRDIDPSTALAGGGQIEGIAGLKQALLAREDQVVRCLIKKLLTYSSGRRLEPSDRGEVDRIAGELAKRGNRLRDLIHLIVGSEVFLNRIPRASPQPH
jgi:hypothetical protein